MTSSLRVVLFTDSAMHRDVAGHVYPIRDRFPAFASGLRDRVKHLGIAARCLDGAAEDPSMRPHDLTPHPHSTFVGLPYYADTEAAYRRRASLARRTRPRIDAALGGADLVLLRQHHAFGNLVFARARRRGLPVVAYWAGPPITESAARNHAPGTWKGRIARLVAAYELARARAIARQADAHVFLDPTEHALMGHPEPTTWLAPNLVDADDVVDAPTPRSAGDPLELIFVGRLVRHKGVLELVDAVDRLHQHGRAVRLTIVGDGPDREAVDTAAQASAADVEVLGHQDGETVKAHLRRRHALVLPSYAEGVPKVLWEAWAAGVVPLVSDVGGVATYLRDGHNGALLRPGDVAGLARTIDALAADDASRRRLAEAGLATVARHTRDASLDTLADALHDAHARRARRAEP